MLRKGKLNVFLITTKKIGSQELNLRPRTHLELLQLWLLVIGQINSDVCFLLFNLYELISFLKSNKNMHVI